MKESNLIEMKNKIEILGAQYQNLLQEFANLKNHFLGSVEVMKKGGNAYDAMIAVHLALAVVHPTAGNIGGGGFFVYSNSDGTSGSLDFREMAPGQAYKDMYLDENGNVIPDMST